VKVNYLCGAREALAAKGLLTPLAREMLYQQLHLDAATDAAMRTGCQLIVKSMASRQNSGFSVFPTMPRKRHRRISRIFNLGTRVLNVESVILLLDTKLGHPNSKPKCPEHCLSRLRLSNTCSCPGNQCGHPGALQRECERHQNALMRSLGEERLSASVTPF